jgi:DNA-binding response OmpR family regulator
MNKSFALIVEDDFELGEVFAVVLKVSDFDTELVRDGQLALKRLSEKVPDIVILDMHLPGISGLDILDQIRADARLSGVKVVVVTADALLASASDDKADITLIKPVSYHQLSDLSTRLIQKRTPN